MKKYEIIFGPMNSPMNPMNIIIYVIKLLFNARIHCKNEYIII